MKSCSTYFPTCLPTGFCWCPRTSSQGEQRPVVVCQHGLEGRPTDVADPHKIQPVVQSVCLPPGRARLHHLRAAEPVHLHRQVSHAAAQGQSAGQDALLDHRAAASADRRLAGRLPHVDPERIAFYGLSYGGKTAMRVPALVEQYCLSICSADFNEWIWKNASTRSPYSYVRDGRVRDLRVRPGQHLQLRRDGGPDRAAAVHGRARPSRRRRRPTPGFPTSTPRSACCMPI